MAESKKSARAASRQRKVRYAVVGLGYIAQVAVLPAFAHARKNSELAALVSDDPVKLKKLGKKYNIERLYSYEEYDDCLASGEVDAVYIALPNHLHRDYSVRAAQARLHVLCEKPMAVTEQECEEMIRAAEDNRVKLMIAYRLHFEEANLKAVEMVKSGKLGEARLFDSVFTMQVKEGDIRLQPRELGGGTLYDIGIYCINAARYLFRDEPIEVMAATANINEPRFADVEAIASAMLRFPDERLATFTCSFGLADTSAYRIIGVKGDLRLDPAYEYAGELKHHLTINGQTRERKFPKRDQFAAELTYFSDCVLSNRQPEPSGKEGLIDVQIIRALYASAEKQQPIKLNLAERDARPAMAQQIQRPPVKKPELVRTASPSGKR
jgi:glucose-fructose oxidoreductase